MRYFAGQYFYYWYVHILHHYVVEYVCTGNIKVYEINILA